MGKSWYLLQSTKQGAGLLLLNSWAPPGIRGKDSYRLKSELRSAQSAHIQASSWSAAAHDLALTSRSHSKVAVGFCLDLEFPYTIIPGQHWTLMFLSTGEANDF